MTCLIIYCLNCIWHDQNSTYKKGLRALFKIWSCQLYNNKNFPCVRAIKFSFLSSGTVTSMQIYNFSLSRDNCYFFVVSRNCSSVRSDVISYPKFILWKYTRNSCSHHVWWNDLKPLPKWCRYLYFENLLF